MRDIKAIPGPPEYHNVIIEWKEDAIDWNKLTDKVASSEIRASTALFWYLFDIERI